MSDPLLDPERLLRIRNQPDSGRQHRGKCFQTRKIYYSVYRVECIFSSQIVKDCNCMTQTLQLNIVWQRQTAGDVLTGFLSRTSIHRVPIRPVKIQQSEKKFNSNEKKSESRNLSFVSYAYEQNVFLVGIRSRIRAGPKSSILLIRIHNTG